MTDTILINGNEEPYDASNPAHVKERRRDEKRKAQDRAELMKALMSIPQGRKWIREILEFCSVGRSIFSTSELAMAHNSGMQDVGLRIMADAMSNESLYLQMMREGEEQ